MSTQNALTYPELKTRAVTTVRRRNNVLKWAVFVWIINLGLSFAKFPFMNKYPWIGISLNVLCGLLTSLWVYFIVKALRLNLLRNRWEHPSGSPAKVSQEVIDAARGRLNALKSACETYDPFTTEEFTVRVQNLTLLSSNQRKDFLLEWDSNGKAVIPVGKSQSIHLEIINNRPMIIGVTNEGTDASPCYQEHATELQLHVPLALFRGEGDAQRLLMAITYLGGKYT